MAGGDYNRRLLDPENMSETDLALARGVNRRLTARVTCQLQAAYRGGVGAWHPATAMDLSRRGCRLRLGEELARGSHASVRFSHVSPNGGGVVVSAEVGGAVMWSRLEGLSYQAGIHFPDDSQSLLELLGTL
jgi:PilZ domain